MNQPFFTYDQESGEKAGVSSFEGGAYVGMFTEAKYKKANSGSHGLEFTFETPDGSTFNYLTIYFAKANNDPIKMGQNVLNALMGLMNVRALNWTQKDGENYCEELADKPIGLFLQKVLYTKNDGDDGYRFEIKMPFDVKTRQTLKEMVGNIEAKTINSLSESYQDKDERGQNQTSQHPKQQAAGVWPV